MAMKNPGRPASLARIIRSHIPLVLLDSDSDFDFDCDFDRETDLCSLRAGLRCLKLKPNGTLLQRYLCANLTQLIGDQYAHAWATTANKIFAYSPQGISRSVQVEGV
jgi:hypothetical protein